MKTSLDIGEDVMRIVEQISERRGTTVGEVLSELARRALRSYQEDEVEQGVPLLRPTADAGEVTLESIARLLDDEC